MQHDRRIQFADLNQPQVGGTGLAEQAVELFGMFGVHQHVHRHPLAEFGQGAADLQIAQVRGDQHLPTALLVQLGAGVAWVDQGYLFQAELTVPHIELVEQGVGEAHKMAQHRQAAGLQFGAAAPVGQIALVLADAAPRLGAEQVEIQHDQVQQRADQPAAEQARQPGGELHQNKTAALALPGPMLLAHPRHLRQRICGARSNMPKNSLVCIFEINALSSHRRKCERPSSG